MGWFSPYVYKSKSGQKFWLHIKEKGKSRLYYFSKDMSGALNNLPKGFAVVENKRTGMPMLKKKEGGLLSIFGSKTKKPEEKKKEKK